MRNAPSMGYWSEETTKDRKEKKQLIGNISREHKFLTKFTGGITRGILAFQRMVKMQVELKDGACNCTIGLKKNIMNF